MTEINKSPLLSHCTIKLSSNTAAKIIQRNFRIFKASRAADGLCFNTKKIIEAHMKRVCAHFNYVPTAILSNIDIEKLDIERQCMLLADINYASTISINTAISKNVANCAKLAVVLYALLKKDPNLTHIHDKLKILHLKEPNEHVVVGLDNMIIDPWLKYTNSTINGKHTPLFVKAQEKKRGFLGDVDTYIRLLKANPDGKYIHDNSAIIFEEIHLSVSDVNKIKTDSVKNALI